MRVLIVEDEALIAMMIEDAVEVAGHEVAGVATNITDALTAVATGVFDVALLDMNLNGQKGHPLPVTARARGKPFAFVTGYGQAGVLAQFAEAPMVIKPFRYEDIAAALGHLQAALSR